MRLGSTRQCTIPATLSLLLVISGCAGVERSVEEPQGRTDEKTQARESSEPARAAIESVEQQTAGGDAVGALAAYEEAFGRSPVGSQDTVLYAGLLREAGRQAEARRVLETLLAGGSRDAEALYGLALLEQSGGNREQYRKLLEEALESDPDHAASLAALGELRLADGETQEARDLFERALVSDENNVVALSRLGAMALEERDLEKAENYFDRTIQAAPEFPFGYYDRSKVRRRRSDYQGAMDDLDRALELDPGYYWGYIDRGRVHLLFGRLEEATRDFEAAGQLDPENFVSYVYASGALYQLERWDAAAEAFQKIIDLEPDYSFAYPPLGEIYYRQERWEDAAATFVRGFEQSPQEAYLPLLAALAIKWSGEEAVARQFLTDNLNRLPPQGWIRTTAEFLIRPDYDLPMISAIKGEDNPITKKRMLFYLGVQYLMMNRPHAAVVYLLDAADLDRDDLLEIRLASWELERRGIDE